MVLLAMTPALAEVVRIYIENVPYESKEGEPSFESPAAGNPITHSQIMDISRYFKEHTSLAHNEDTKLPVRLDELLRGCAVYKPPQEPKKEQTPEFKALMARLRQEEEARAYERMLNPPLPHESFGQRYPNSQFAALFPSYDTMSKEDEEVTYAEVNRQVALIFNVLISIVACSASLWMVARYWSVPARLALSMSGSIIVAVAEVVIYSGYLRRVTEAKTKERKKVEHKTIEETWVIGPKQGSRNNETKTAGKTLKLEGLRARPIAARSDT